jgi:hypothetical protein
VVDLTSEHPLCIVRRNAVVVKVLIREELSDEVANAKEL